MAFEEIDKSHLVSFDKLKEDIESVGYSLNSHEHLDTLVNLLDSGRNIAHSSCDILLFVLQCITRGPCNVNTFAISMNINLMELLLDFASKTILSASETNSAAVALRILTFLQLDLSGDEYYRTIGINLTKLHASEPNTLIQKFSEGIHLCAESSRRYYSQTLSAVLPLILTLLSEKTSTVFKATLGLTLFHNLIQSPSNLSSISEYFEKTANPTLTFVPQVDASTKMSLPNLQLSTVLNPLVPKDSYMKQTNIQIPLLYWIIRAAGGGKPLPFDIILPEKQDSTPDPRKGTIPSGTSYRYEPTHPKPAYTPNSVHWSTYDSGIEILTTQQREERQWLRTVALSVLSEYISKASILVPTTNQHEIAIRSDRDEARFFQGEKQYPQFIPIEVNVSQWFKKETTTKVYTGASRSKQSRADSPSLNLSILQSVINLRLSTPQFRKREIDLSFFQHPFLIYPLLTSPTVLCTIVNALYDLPHSTTLVRCAHQLREFLFVVPHYTFPFLFLLLPDLVVCSTKHPSFLIPELAIYFSALEAYKLAPENSSTMLEVLSKCVANIQRKLVL